ncbi:flavodoxin domain-containing protein [Streptomyces vietnamensis]|uniref:Flavodoxin n=1 Tax=Streptomyces vietnamensis TaxID=362257 RepID=A0A0B5I4H7_9ACTN|nr:flavodoxin domain-containing protein [Streptomyces vietnamensis]AJF63179.1 flavodoxin [Streptomyces vietnamensis]
MNAKRVLVAYGSKHGATAGIADEIGKTLRADGIDVVVLGGALYAGRWNGKARRCARLNADQLRRRPVWFFSSGPVDSSAEQHDIPPTPGVARRMKKIGAREHVTFGGAVTAETPGRIARSMVHHGKGGDFRDPARIQAWAHHIGSELGTAR